MQFTELKIAVLKVAKGARGLRALSLEMINKSLMPQSINHLSQVTMCVSVSDI